MRINCVSNLNSNKVAPSYGKAKILKSSFLDKGFEMAIEETKSSRMKDLDNAKAFFDNLKKISDNRYINSFKLDAEEVNNGGIKEVLASTNGKPDILWENHDMSLTPGYLCMESVASYARDIKSDRNTTYLDVIHETISNLQIRLAQAKEEFARELQKQLQNMQNNINR